MRPSSLPPVANLFPGVLAAIDQDLNSIRLDPDESIGLGLCMALCGNIVTTLGLNIQVRTPCIPIMCMYTNVQRDANPRIPAHSAHVCAYVHVRAERCEPGLNAGALSVCGGVLHRISAPGAH